MDEIQKLAIETIEKDKQAIVFVPSRASAEKTAEDIAKHTNFSCPEIERDILKDISPTKQCRRLSLCVRKGIAFHHSGLTSRQKDLIEENFKKGDIRIICCTPTLAAGLSLLVFRVIIKSLKRYSTKWGMDWIPVLEYMQMAGRAGRPEYEKFGESIVIAKNFKDKEEIHEKYICGEAEDIYSKLAVEPVLRTYLLSLVSSGIIIDKKSMQEFFAKTFWAHQYKDMAKLELIMDKMLELLDEWEFVKLSGNEEKSDFVVASNIGKEIDQKMSPTVIGKRVSELYLDPLTARHLLNCLQKFKGDTFSLLQMVSHTLEMRPLLRVKVKEEDSIQEELVKYYDQLLMDEPSTFDSDYGEFMNSIKTALFFNAWIDEKDEDYLLEKFAIRPGEIRYKNDAADWLLYASQELADICGFREAVREIRKLRIRIKKGVREELLPLLKLKGVGRIRARKMFTHGIKDMGDIKKTDITSLAQLIGGKLAAEVKNLVGEEVHVVPKGTRKGQLSLHKFK